MKFFDLPAHDPSDTEALHELSRWIFTKFPDLITDNYSGQFVVLNDSIVKALKMNRPMTVIVGRTGSGDYVLRCDDKIVYDITDSDIRTIPYIFPVVLRLQ